MRLRNLTPFHVLAFQGVDPEDEELHVVVMRVGYQLVPGNGQFTHRAELLQGDDAVELAMEDEPWGEVHASSWKAESDLAPMKTACDVIVNATTRAPDGRAAPRWETRVRISDRDDHALLDKTLSACGPRWFEESPDGWSLSAPEPITELAMRWEHAFGGASLLRDEDAPPDAPPELNEVCYLNPLGKGWIEERHFDALRDRPRRLPAPQIEKPGEELRAPVIARHPDGEPDAKAMKAIASKYGHRPAGLGVVGRAWTPRLQKAGTYDRQWEEERWPMLPRDSDFGYWNAAPEDQQIDFPPTDFRLELSNLAREARVSVEMPGHRALVVAYRDEGPFAIEMAPDTILVDTDEMRVDIVFRAFFPIAAGVREVEARFEVDPNAPLVKIEPPPADPGDSPSPRDSAPSASPKSDPDEEHDG